MATTFNVNSSQGLLNIFFGDNFNWNYPSERYIWINGGASWNGRVHFPNGVYSVSLANSMNFNMNINREMIPNSVTNMNGFLTRTTKFNSDIDWTNLNGVQKISNMFSYMNLNRLLPFSLKNLPPSINDVSYMFYNASFSTGLNGNNHPENRSQLDIDFTHINNASHMFENASGNLCNLDLNFNFSHIHPMNTAYMFYNWAGLYQESYYGGFVNLLEFTVMNGSNAYYMFNNPQYIPTSMMTYNRIGYYDHVIHFNNYITKIFATGTAFQNLVLDFRPFYNSSLLSSRNASQLYSTVGLSQPSSGFNHWTPSFRLGNFFTTIDNMFNNKYCYITVDEYRHILSSDEFSVRLNTIINEDFIIPDSVSYARNAFNNACIQFGSEYFLYDDYFINENTLDPINFNKYNFKFHNLYIPSGITNAVNMFANARFYQGTFSNFLSSSNVKQLNIERYVVINDHSNLSNLSYMFINADTQYNVNDDRVSYVNYTNIAKYSTTHLVNADKLYNATNMYMMFYHAGSISDTSILIGNNVTNYNSFISPNIVRLDASYGLNYSGTFRRNNTYINIQSPHVTFNNSNELLNYIFNVNDNYYFTPDWVRNNFNIGFGFGPAFTNLDNYFSALNILNGYNSCNGINAPMYFGPTVTTINCFLCGAQNFNGPVEMSNSIVSAHSAFKFCGNFNQQINLSTNLINASNMFYSCYNLNQQIVLPDSIENASNMFYGCSKLLNVTIPKNITNGRSMLCGCYNISTNVIVPNEVLSYRNILSIAYNAPRISFIIKDPNNFFETTNRLAWYQYLYGVNLIQEGSYYKHLGGFIYDENGDYLNYYNEYGDKNIRGASYFNYPYSTYKENCYELCLGCTNLNSPVDIPSTAYDTSYMFYDCINFNQPFILPSLNLINTSHMFENCKNFMQDIIIPETVRNADNMFANTFVNNRPFTMNIDIKSTNISLKNFFANSYYPNTYENASLYYPNVILYDGIKDLSWMLYNSYFEGNINIPSSVTNLYRFAENCNYLKDVIINVGSNVTNCMWLASNNIHTRCTFNFMNTKSDIFSQGSYAYTSGGFHKFFNYIFRDCNSSNQNWWIPPSKFIFGPNLNNYYELFRNTSILGDIEFHANEINYVGVMFYDSTFYPSYSYSNQKRDLTITFNTYLNINANQAGIFFNTQLQAHENNYHNYYFNINKVSGDSIRFGNATIYGRTSFLINYAEKNQLNCCNMFNGFRIFNDFTFNCNVPIINVCDMFVHPNLVELSGRLSYNSYRDQANNCYLNFNMSTNLLSYHNVFVGVAASHLPEIKEFKTDGVNTCNMYKFVPYAPSTSVICNNANFTDYINGSYLHNDWSINLYGNNITWSIREMTLYNEGNSSSYATAVTNNHVMRGDVSFSNVRLLPSFISRIFGEPTYASFGCYNYYVNIKGNNSNFLIESLNPLTSSYYQNLYLEDSTIIVNASNSNISLTSFSNSGMHLYGSTCIIIKGNNINITTRNTSCYLNGTNSHGINFAIDNVSSINFVNSVYIFGNHYTNYYTNRILHFHNNAEVQRFLTKYNSRLMYDGNNSRVVNVLNSFSYNQSNKCTYNTLYNIYLYENFDFSKY